MKMKSTILAGIFFISVGGKIIAQEPAKGVLNWYNGKKSGMQTDKAYKKLLKNKKGEKVIVAVIDSGVDIEHEDLKDVIWVNKDEIPGNGIDDDKNGYIDDVHGWNFLGGKDGRNANDAQLEVTRIYARLDKKYNGKTDKDIRPADVKEYEKYLEVKKVVEDELASATMQMKQIAQMKQIYKQLDDTFVEKLGKDYTKKDLKKALKDPDLKEGAETLLKFKAMGLDEKMLDQALEHFESSVKYHYNKDFTEDRDIIGDNPSDFSDTDYGNNDVEGPDALHGTHCSGIIAAVRNNGIGNDGVADNVLIMPIRAVPNGDERDKDIALGVRYAVDNGAQIISMSFGKGYSENDEEVIKAFKYAEDHGVLLVHAAGNSSQDNDRGGNYPTPKYPSMDKKFSNWLEVGASTRYKKRLAASFSNYGDTIVDVFAPGLEIYSTVPQSEYLTTQGTSMACPMVSGVAALLKSYYPSLSMVEIKEIIKESVYDVSNKKTPKPGGTKKDLVKFGTLSNTGGIVNVYKAVKLAEERTAKK